MNRIEFLADTDGIVPVVDRRRLDAAIGDEGWLGLVGIDAVLVARMVQGWRPQDLGLERAETRQVAEPLARGAGWLAYRAEVVSEVVAVLPGGDRPEVAALDAVYARPGVPVMGCGCGGGIGCAALEVEVSFTRDAVLWRVAGHRFEFPRGGYSAAVRELLGLIGETPELITDEEWAAPTPTRVRAARRW